MNSENPWGEQDENGIDIAQLRYNRSLTADEQIARNKQAADRVLKCRRAAEDAGVRPKQNAPFVFDGWGVPVRISDLID